MFEWNEQLSCNIKVIDDQHKKLLEIGSELYSLLTTVNYNDHYDDIMNLLHELKDYTVYHFKTEEDLLQDFSGFRLHKAQHDSFVDKINEILAEDIDDNQKVITTEIMIFVADWISNHIMKTDKLYIDFMLDKGVK